MESTVRELLAVAQTERKVKLGPGRVDTVFQVCDREMLQTKELVDATDIGKLRPDGIALFSLRPARAPMSTP